MRLEWVWVWVEVRFGLRLCGRLTAHRSKSSDLMDVDADGEEVDADSNAHCVVLAYHSCMLDVDCKRPIFHI